MFNFDPKSEQFLSRRRLYSWCFIFVFSGLVLYDTQKLINNGTIITNVCNATVDTQFACADYPKASLSLILDTINLFQRTTNVNN